MKQIYNPGENMKNFSSQMTNLTFVSALLFCSWFAHVHSASSSNNSQIVMDEVGNSVAIWAKKIEGVSIIQSSTISSEGNCSTPTTLCETSLSAYGPIQTINANGDVIAGWIETNPETMNNGLRTAMYNRNTKTWGEAVTLSSPNEQVGSFEIVMNDLGDISAMWDSIIIVEPLEFATRLSKTTFGSSTWSPPITLGSSTQ